MLDLLTRHFLPGDMYEAHKKLAGVCPGITAGIHKNSQTRTAGEAYAIDLHNSLLQLSNEKKLPKLLVSSDDLGKVPFSALSVSSERSVSARLESLESCVTNMTSTLEKVTASLTSTRAPSVPMPGLHSGVAAGPTVASHYEGLNYGGVVTGNKPVQAVGAPAAQVPVPALVVTPATGHGQHSPSWAEVAATGSDSLASALIAGRERQKCRSVLGDPIRERSTSSSSKRKAPGEDNDGFRPQGRPRKTAGGSSKVDLEDLGECQASLQYYISNTPGNSTDELIKKVLEKCSAPLLKEQTMLTIHKVECLTKEEEPRTRCWKVEVPFKFKSLMENDELYPEGWRHRKFFGDRRNNQQKSKHAKLSDSRIKEAEQELEKERLELLQRQDEERTAVEQGRPVDEENQQDQSGEESGTAGTGPSTQ